MQEITLTSRQLCDLELLLNGAFSPLTGYLTEQDYNSVVHTLHLTTGELWPMPIVLSISPETRDLLVSTSSKEILLKDEYNFPIATVSIQDIYKPDLGAECQNVYGTTDINHPYVKYLMETPHNYYVGGKVDMINMPNSYDFEDLRLTPSQTKEFFKENNWKNIIGFHTRNPMHRSHMELTLNSVREVEIELGQGGGSVNLLIQPVVGITQECDVDYHTRVNCYKKLLTHYPDNLCKLAVISLAMRMAGPREAMWHALIRKNYGCTHFIVGRDHAGPSYKTKSGKSFYDPYAAHDLLEKHKTELGIKIIRSMSIVYVEQTDRYYSINELPDGMQGSNISGTMLRELLETGAQIPAWFSFPDVVEELRKEYPPKHKQGFCIYLTGLSGSGKTTTVKALEQKLLERGDTRKITILDGDIVRQNLSKGLGFSKQDRSTNVRRIGYVASEIVKHGGVCLVANIAPYEEDRNHNRDIIAKNGGYIEVFVDTDLTVCESRDTKGLYAKARAGLINEFTGISDPYEVPLNNELTLNGTHNIRENVDYIMNFLLDRSYLN